MKSDFKQAIKDAYIKNFFLRIKNEIEDSDDQASSVLTKIYTDILYDNGSISDYVLLHFEKEISKSTNIKISGFSFSEEDLRLDLFVTHYDPSEKIEKIESSKVLKLIDTAKNFYLQSIKKLHEKGCENLIILPLYPQYAAATTATVCDEVYRTLMKMRWQPSIKIIPPLTILSNNIFKASENVNEKVWRLPLHKNYDKLMDSTVADVQNINYAGGAGSITAAQFLQRFITNKTPWAHLDIAGMAFSKKAANLNPGGATGFGVRLLNNLIKEFYE